MNHRGIEFLVYLIGLAPLGAFQAQAREAIGNDAAAFGAVIVYLLFLRLLGRILARRFGRE